VNLMLECRHLPWWLSLLGIPCGLLLSWCRTWLVSRCRHCWRRRRVRRVRCRGPPCSRVRKHRCQCEQCLSRLRWIFRLHDVWWSMVPSTGQ
jgi:hypothetical protein